MKYSIVRCTLKVLFHCCSVIFITKNGKYFVSLSYSVLPLSSNILPNLYNTSSSSLLPFHLSPSLPNYLLSPSKTYFRSAKGCFKTLLVNTFHRNVYVSTASKTFCCKSAGNHSWSKGSKIV